MKKILNISVLFILILISSKTSWCKNIILDDVFSHHQILDIKVDNLLIMVFAQNPSCHDCFLKLNNQLEFLRQKKYTYNLFLINNYQKDIVSRKLCINYFNELIKVDSIFFDINETVKSKDSTKLISLFRKYKVNSTPSVLMLFKDKEVFLPLNVLRNSNYKIIEEKIIELLKK